jgi:hypothetical protein
MSRPNLPSTRLVKPSADTKFHIDYEWWDKSGKELDTYLAEHLCASHREKFSSLVESESTKIDWVDPVTGVVSAQRPLIYVLLSHCSQQADFITERTSLIDAVFRVLIAAGNRPMTPAELSRLTGRSADTILKTLSGRTVYQGLRPAQTS